MFVVFLECACVARIWIWLRRPFDASPRVDRVLAYVRRRLPLYIGRKVVYLTGWPFYFLIAEDLRPPRQIQVALGVAITAVLCCSVEYFTPIDFECVLCSLEPLLLFF